MKIISVCSQKGGVGKTTITYHLAWGLYELGHPVLLVDIDPQGNLSIVFGKDSCNSLDIFSDDPVIKSELVIGEGRDIGISLVASDLGLAKAESHTSYDSYTKLKRALSKTENIWDYIIIDCPPSLGIFTLNSFTTARYLLVPALPGYFSLVGIRDLMEVADAIKEEGFNRDLQMLGIVINQAERTVVTREAISVLQENFPDLIFSTIIPKSVRVEEALQNRKPVWQYEEDNPASTAFKNLTEEFIKKIEEVPHGKKEVAHEGNL